MSIPKTLTLTNANALLARWLKFCGLHPAIRFLVKFLPIFGIFWLMAWWHLDPDFGWHLQAGNYIRQYGIPAHDIFTYTAHNFRWIDHEWGNDVIVSFIYQLGKYWLLSLIFALIWTVSLFINNSKAWFSLLLLATLAMTPYSGVRAVTWTILCLALLIRLATSRSTYLRWLIPLLFIVWANLHSGFVIGFVYIIYLAIKDRKLFWWLILVLTIAASFCNPYGPRLYVEIWRTLSDPALHHEIKEWYMFSIPFVTMSFVMLWGVGYVYNVLYGKRRFWKLFPFSLVLFVAALSATRNFPLFINSSVQDTKQYLDDIRQRLPKPLDRVRKRIMIFIIFIFAGAAIIGFCRVVSPNKQSYPMQAVAYLSANPCSGNLFNAYNYGGYLIWKLPSEPVYIDGRMPSWRNNNGVKYFTTYENIIGNQSVQQAQFAKYNIRCAIVTNDSEFFMMIQDLENQHWEVVVNANQSVLLIAPKPINIIPSAT